MSFGEREGGMSLQNDAIQPRNPSRRLAREVFSLDLYGGGTQVWPGTYAGIRLCGSVVLLTKKLGDFR